MSITIVYWDNGKKVVIKDYLASSVATPLDFIIQNPTALPPFILYLDSDCPTAIDIEIDYELPLIVGPINEIDERILADENLFPILDADEFQQILDKKPINIIGKLIENGEITPLR